MSSTIVEDVLNRLKDVTRTSKGWQCRCPVHDDNKASLSISMGDDGRVLIYCHANCETADVVSAIGLTMTDLFAESPKHDQKVKSKIVAEYDYCDENGALLYQAVRLEPKGFRQRTPKADGGWQWKLGNVRRVLYQLPELIKAELSEPVLVVEGEKDVDRLRTLGLVATCNAGGAGKWRSEYSDSLQNRHVVILPDNDAAGREHCEKVAVSLAGKAASIRVLELPGLLEKGDVSDWLDAGGTADELRELIDAAPEWEPSEDDCSTPEILRWQPFPTHLLPPPVSAFVENAAAAIGCDESFLALPTLAALAGSIGNSRRIELKRGWSEPPVLWIAVIAESGTQKSPSLEAALKLLQDRQTEAFIRHEEALEQYERDLTDHKAAVEEWKRTGRKNGDPPPDPLEEPIAWRIIASDVTVEALATLLKNQPRGLLLVRDELSGWLGSFDAYRGGRGGDAAHWLSMHRAGPMSVDRKTGDRKTIFVPRAAVSVVGGIQPTVLTQALGEAHFENGLASRLLLAAPPRKRKIWTENETDDDVLRLMNIVYDRLLALEFTTTADGREVPDTLPLSADGKDAWISFYNDHAAEQTEMQGKLTAAWSKHESHVARIALIIHCVRAATGDVADDRFVDAESVNAAVGLVDWFKNETKRFYSRLDESAEDSVQRRLIDFITERGSVTARDIYRSGLPYSDREEAEQALFELVGQGVLQSMTLTNPQGGRPTTRFVLVETPKSVEANAKTPSKPGNDEVLAFGMGTETGTDSFDNQEWGSV